MTVGDGHRAAPEQPQGSGSTARGPVRAGRHGLPSADRRGAVFDNTQSGRGDQQHLSAAPPHRPCRPVGVRAGLRQGAGKDPRTGSDCRDFARAMQALWVPQQGGSARHRKPDRAPVLRRRWVPAVGTTLAGAVAVAAVVADAQRSSCRPRQPAGPPPAMSSRMDLPVVVIGADCAVLGRSRRRRNRCAGRLLRPGRLAVSDDGVAALDP